MASRESKLTKQFIEGMAEAVRKNMPDEAACGLFKVGVSTFYKWKAQGIKDANDDIESIHRDMVEAIKAAEGEAIEESLALIREAGKFPTRWQARAWLLERCFRQWFSIQGEVAEKILAQLEELRARLDKRENKSVGAKANGELDQESDKPKTQGSAKKETRR